ncbi:MAG: polysaccharide deacetylase family protein [Selenomonadaceae bacterium]|nr:polysaccharide deacetylase family protein [Selenomonadaceae bacterium]
MKNLLIALAAVLLIIGGTIFWMFQRESDGVPILIYHRVSDTDTNPTTLRVADFEQQIKYLADSGYTAITPDELLDSWQGGRKLPAKPIILTFDDGHNDIYNNVLPILQEHNMCATVFIVTNHIGMPQYLSWEQTRLLQGSGLIDIESHTMSYKNLAALKGDKLWDEIYGSKQAIEWVLKKPAKFIAFPDGKYSVAAEETCKEVGFRAGFVADYGLANVNYDSYVLTRIPVQGSNSSTMFRFKLRLNGAPIFAPLSRLKEHLKNDGNPEIAEFIFIP